MPKMLNFDLCFPRNTFKCRQMAKIVEFLMTSAFHPFKRAKRYGLLYYNIRGNRQKRVALLRFKSKFHAQNVSKWFIIENMIPDTVQQV